MRQQNRCTDLIAWTCTIRQDGSSQNIQKTNRQAHRQSCAGPCMTLWVKDLVLNNGQFTPEIPEGKIMTGNSGYRKRVPYCVWVFTVQTQTNMQVIVKRLISQGLIPTVFGCTLQPWVPYSMMRLMMDLQEY